MSAGQDERCEALIAQFDDFVDGIFAPLEAWLPRLQQQLTERLALGPITGAQLTAMVEDEAHAVLESTDRPLYGAGFCAADAVVAEGNPLAWWQGPDRALLASSTFGPGQAAIDLQRLEWYRVPAETHERHIAGPFVDYLCSNEITLTAAIPVMLDGQFSGVLCADVLVASLENLLLPLLQTLEGAALVNSSGRVVVSAHHEYETGDRFAGGFEKVRSGRYPFELALPAAAV
ncbi:MAG: hypothetical protein LCH36_01835 [Actinobacteria bacterium]|nr:hypothetical protein [Actinomycetota bacterium]